METIKYGRGKHPNSHKNKQLAGRKPLYEGERAVVVLCTSARLAKRLQDEAARRGVSRNHIFNEWLETLPLNVDEKTKAMEERYKELRAALK